MVCFSFQNMSQGSSVSIVSGYGPDNWAIEVRSPAYAKDFSSSLCIQTGSGATQPPVQWVRGVLFLGVKRGRGVTLTTHPYPVPRSRMSRSYTSSPSLPPIGVLWDCLVSRIVKAYYMCITNFTVQDICWKVFIVLLPRHYSQGGLWSPSQCASICPYSAPSATTFWPA
jgi:hypothetical protein